MNKYRVIIQVVYTDSVEAESEQEAIQEVLDNCPYDNASEVEPVVEKIE